MQIQSSIPGRLDYNPSPHLSNPAELNHIMTFVEIIFPIQYGSYTCSVKTDRSWIFHTLISTESFYQATTAVNTNFKARIHDTNPRDSPHTSPAELISNTQLHQSKALLGLNQLISNLAAGEYQGRELLSKGMQALAIMTELISLEVLYFLDGSTWEVHLRASRTILGLFQHQWMPEMFTRSVPCCSLQDSDDMDFKALEFFIISFMWVDIIANATLGPPRFDPSHFDYLPLLKRGVFMSERVMGCKSVILIAITEITGLERWKEEQLREGCLSMIELVSRGTALNHLLIQEISASEKGIRDGGSGVKVDGIRVNLMFAYGALIYLHTVISGKSPQIPEVKNNVEKCLEWIEELPSRLLIRICWPFTIVGCMATEEQYEKFRRVFKSVTKSGSVWKGVMVMEECWKLRNLEREKMWCWRSTMERMGLRILLF